LISQQSILIATQNRGKLAEIRAALRGLRVDIVCLDDFPDLPPADETENSFAGNARLKASHYSRLTGLWALADDSGLEVDALHGAPGVRSARFAGESAGDEDNNRKLIDALRCVDPSLRTARFRCAIAVADGDTVLLEADGALEGLIVETPKGDNGFGYDPHFWIANLGMTVAELTAAGKNKISHRGRALRPVASQLVAILRDRAGG